MIKRIEFSLNLDDPQEAEIYRALLPSLRYRRAGAVIRNALGKQLVDNESITESVNHVIHQGENHGRKQNH
jgi:hypothetical protein